jgi:hypothetical protein
MFCFDSIKGKCQRKDPPCKYLHPPQHLKEILLQNGRQNLIYKNLQLQAAATATFQQMVPMQTAQPAMIPFMYEPTGSSVVKQPTLIQAAAGYHSPASGGYQNGNVVLQQGPSAGTAPQYFAMIPQSLTPSGHPQFILPATSYACYNPLGAATAGISPSFYQTIDLSGAAGSSLLTSSQGPVMSPASVGPPNGTWNIAGLPAGCYGIPAGAIHAAIPYDSNSFGAHYQQNFHAINSALPASASSSAGALVNDPSSSADDTSPPLCASSSADMSAATAAVTSSAAYCQPVYYKRQVLEVVSGGMGRKRSYEAVGSGGGSGEDVILGIPHQGIPQGIPNGIPGGLVLKRPALIDSKTGLPVYRQFATAASYQQMAALNAMQQLQQQQQQQFISIPIAGHGQVLPRF